MIINKTDKIVILGGTGHLGSSLTHYLVKNLKLNPQNIRIFYLKNSPTESLKKIQNLDLYPGNILDKEDVYKACIDRDYVFHMVGNTTFDPRQKALQWQVNVEGTRNVLDVCKESKQLKRLCYTSTINTLAIPYPLGTIGIPSDSSPYKSNKSLFSFKSSNEVLNFIEKVKLGEVQKVENKIRIGYLDSKLAAQELVNSYYKKYDLNVVSVLPGTMLGAHDYLLSAGMYLIAMYNRKIPFVLKGGMSFMHVLDSVDGHLLALEKGKKGAQYAITGKKEDNMYLKELCNKIGKIIKAKNPSKKISTPKLRLGKSLGLIIGFLSEKITEILKIPNPISRDYVRIGSVTSFYSYKEAEKEIGYVPKRTLNKAIEDAYDYYEKEDLWENKYRFIDKR